MRQDGGFLLDSDPILFLAWEKMAVLDSEVKEVGGEDDVAEVVLDGLQVKVALFIDPGVLLQVVYAWPSHLGLLDQLLVDVY